MSPSMALHTSPKMNIRHHDNTEPLKKISRVVVASFLAAVLAAQTSIVPPALAESRVVGEISGSGLVFKDTLRIESFDDPKVKVNVTMR